MLSQQAIFEGPEPNTLLVEDLSLYHGFVQLPKLVLYARNLSRDAKLLYAVLLGYAWQERRCFPGYTRLCDDLDASENMVRKYMRELEAAHLLSQRRRGLGRTNIYTLHDLRTAKIEVQDLHKIEVLEPYQTAVLEPQEADDYEETEERKTEERNNRTIGERPIIKWRGNLENDEKALVGGEPAEAATAHLVTSRLPTARSRRLAVRGKQINKLPLSPRDQALAQARAVAGAALQEKLRQLGGSNPAGGMDTILEALIEVQTPVELLGALMEVGVRRLEQQQELIHIPNPTGYLIGIMRHLAVEAWLKGWKIEQMRAEDEEKHAQALRGAACAPKSELTSEAERSPEEEAPSAVGGWTDEDLRAAPTSEAQEDRHQEGDTAEAQERTGAAASTSQPQEPQEETAHHEIPYRDGRAKQIWQTTLDRMQSRISPATFNGWFAGTNGLSLCGQVLTVGVSTTFNGSHLETRFHDLVCSLLCDLIGPDAEVRFEIERPEEP